MRKIRSLVLNTLCLRWLQVEPYIYWIYESGVQENLGWNMNWWVVGKSTKSSFKTNGLTTSANLPRLTLTVIEKCWQCMCLWYEVRRMTLLCGLPKPLTPNKLFYEIPDKYFLKLSRSSKTRRIWDTELLFACFPHFFLLAFTLPFNSVTWLPTLLLPVQPRCLTENFIWWWKEMVYTWAI